ncbi:MAG: AgmX/PglI C-terminal domain-containing protein [Myxococcales bacterium]|nr:AgmX/PglI C-terminal domain-containing protein [Myxococcales bacterium]
MQSCTTLNVAASLVLVTLVAYAGCGGNTPAPSAAPATSAAPGGESPKGDQPSAPSGDSPKPDEGKGEPAADGGGEAETRTTEVIQKLVQENRKPVRECYEKARKQIPDLKGTMTIHFVLDPEGKVKEAVLNVEKSEVKSPDVVKCAVEVIKKIKFPASSRGMESTINYPFTFNP